MVEDTGIGVTAALRYRAPRYKADKTPQQGLQLSLSLPFASTAFNGA
jgi:hypothetical protein